MPGWNNRKPLIEVDDGFDPINGVYDVDYGSGMGGQSNNKSKKRRKHSSARSHSSRKSRKRRGFMGLFGRRRRSGGSRRVRKTSRGNVKYTKHGQPYIIMANGRARFIKGRRHK